MKSRQSSGIADNIVVGLDIGTTKICVMIAGRDQDGRINVFGIGKAENEGMARGTVTNIDKTVRSIQQAVQQAERQSGIKVRAVNVVSGQPSLSGRSPPTFRRHPQIYHPDYRISRKGTGTETACCSRRLHVPYQEEY